MYEFFIVNDLNEQKIIFGRSFGEACKAAKLKPEEWGIALREYID